MSITLRRSLASLVIAVLLLSLTASVVGAQTQRIAVSGTQALFFLRDADRYWSTDGTTHFRGDPLGGTFAYSGGGISLSGSVSRQDHGWFDASGDGKVEGFVTYADESGGIACHGPSNGKVANFAFLGDVNARCSDGSLLQGTWQDTGVLLDSQGNVIGVMGTFNGTLVIPSP